MRLNHKYQEIANLGFDSWHQRIQVWNLYCFVYRQSVHKNNNATEKIMTNLTKKQRWLAGEVVNHVGIYGLIMCRLMDPRQPRFSCFYLCSNLISLFYSAILSNVLGTVCILRYKWLVKLNLRSLFLRSIRVCNRLQGHSSCRGTLVGFFVCLFFWLCCLA